MKKAYNLWGAMWFPGMFMPFLVAITDLTHPLQNNRSSIGMIGCYIRARTYYNKYLIYMHTDVHVRKRTFHRLVYLVPHDTVIPPGDGPQKHSVRTIPWYTTAVGGRSPGHAASVTTTFIPYFLTRETGTRIQYTLYSFW